ncbi:DUF1330 domain-containing protein [Ideonella livida]|uniref:DUF1330 domain-containing protein n=1 Tax=Ideonella livida TaxID=2707176 RepID=A0A7C9PIK2_9BURK|nr:DUF1330 domain-containing protein [Ideonella livida]NDY92034.1 DUF1330 domain-containing protein [Ideonella livida]
MKAAVPLRPAYFVIEAKVTDPQGICPYQAQVEATYQAYGGVRVVAGGAPEPLEGTPPSGVIVILRFPSLAQAHAWHASEPYQAILGHRLASAESRAYFVEGIA